MHCLNILYREVDAPDQQDVEIRHKGGGLGTNTQGDPRHSSLCIQCGASGESEDPESGGNL